MNNFEKIFKTIKKMETRKEECKEHGTFEAKNYLGKFWSKCQKCSKEEEKKQEDEDIAQAQRNRLANWVKKVGCSGIPERFHKKTFDNFYAETNGQKAALDFAIDYAKNFSQNLKLGRCALFVGSPGTGKTHLAAAIGLRAMGAENRIVLFVTVMRAIRRVKDTWRKAGGETESEAIESLAAPDLLIIDEIGEQYGSETEKLILFDIINERYEKMKPTIFTSNLPMEDFFKKNGDTQKHPGVKSFLGERIIDRIRENDGKIVFFDGESHRGKKN